MRKARSIEQRFWPKVQKAEGDGCWEWTASLTDLGYGQFVICTSPQRNTRAHRVAWELTNGPVPDGLSVLHHCDNRKCCRPDHLYVGTQAQNVDDMMRRDRWGGAVGEAHHKAKLTEQDVRDIRQTWKNGVSMSELSRRYKVSLYNIQCIVHRRTWKHVV